jgi:hypothetical protein
MQGPEKTAAAAASSGSLPAQCLPVAVTARAGDSEFRVHCTGSGILQAAVD